MKQQIILSTLLLLICFVLYLTNENTSINTKRILKHVEIDTTTEDVVETNKREIFLDKYSDHAHMVSDNASIQARLERRGPK